MKSLFPLAIVAVIALTGCNTIENRRSLYANTKVHGPYTRQLEEGTWGQPKTVDEEYAEQQKVKNGPKLIPGAKKSSSGSSDSGLPAQPDTPLPQ